MKDTFAGHRRAVAIVVVGALAITAGVIGVASASSTPGLDGSVIATLVFPASAHILGGGSPAGHGADSIEISSWSWGVSHTGSSSSAGSSARRASQSSVHDLVITKSTDQSTPGFWRACTSGQHYGTVYLYLDEPTGANPGAAGGYATYMTIKLTNAFIASDTLSGTAGSVGASAPKETVTLGFSHSAITWTQGGKTSTDDWEF